MFRTFTETMRGRKVEVNWREVSSLWFVSFVEEVHGDVIGQRADAS